MTDKIIHLFNAKNIHLNPNIINGIRSSQDDGRPHVFVISLIGRNNKFADLGDYYKLRNKGCEIFFVSNMKELISLILEVGGIIVMHGSISPFRQHVIFLLCLRLLYRETLRKIVLVAWGGSDFYSDAWWFSMYSNILKSFKKIITLSSADQVRCAELYGELAMQLSYITPQMQSYQKKEIKGLRKGKKIMISHSGWQHNNHIESFDLVRHHIEEDTEVICPLAYGDKQYISNVVAEGERVFGERFSYFTELLSVEEYTDMLSGVDIYVTNAEIQTGLFALLTCLSNGAKVFCKGNLFDSMENSGFKVFSIEGLRLGDERFLVIDPEDAEKNISTYLAKYGDIQKIRDAWHVVYR